MVRIEYWPKQFVICLKTAKIIEHCNILRKLKPYLYNFNLQFQFKYRAINGGGRGGLERAQIWSHDTWTAPNQPLLYEVVLLNHAVLIFADMQL